MKKAPKQYEVLKWASLFLEKHNREPNVAEILLMHYLNVSRSRFYMMMRDPIPANTLASFEAAILEHVEAGIPVQHLTGYEMFYGRKFQVNKNVLIPRPETEELVQHVIETVGQQPVNIVDVGTGSGIIAITLALELPQVTVYATDISKTALLIAKKNAEQLQANITFLEGDFLQPVIDADIHADVIVSNPPYIARSEEVLLSDTVKNFDPALALFADDNGLAAYRRIIEQSKQVIRTHAMFAFEIGYTQGEAVCSLIKHTYRASETKIIQDINKKDRIVTAQF